MTLAPAGPSATYLFARRPRPDTSPARTRGTPAPPTGVERDPRNVGSGVPQQSRIQREKENRMRNWTVLGNRLTRRSLLVACSTAVAVGFTVSLPRPAHAAHVTPPDRPADSQVAAGKQPVAHGYGN